MTFELVGGPHDGFTFKARDDIKDRHLDDPKAKMGVDAAAIKHSLFVELGEIAFV
jgi:hypothetical protein